MARSFNGSSDFINVGTSSTLSLSAGNPATIAAWLKINASFATGAHFILARDDNSLGRNFAFGLNNSGIYLEINGIAVNAGALASEVWGHFAISITDPVAGTLTPYINGVAQSAGTNGTPGASTGSVTIGERTYSGSNLFFGGSLADVAFWNTNLSSGQIAALAAGTRPIVIAPSNLKGYWPLDGFASPETDLSGNSNNGTLTGTTRVLGPPAVSRAMGS